MVPTRDDPVPGLFLRLVRAAGVALIGVALGVVAGLQAGAREVAGNGYRALGYTRNAYLELTRAAEEGLRQGLELGRQYGGAYLAVLLIAWVVLPLRLEPMRLLRVLRGAAGPAIGILVAAVITLAGLALLAGERGAVSDPWLLPGDLQVASVAFAVGVLWAVGVTLLARVARDENDRETANIVRAFVIAGVLFVGGGYWINRSVGTPPPDELAVVRNVLLAVVAVALYLVERRRWLLWWVVVGAAGLVSLVPFALRALEGSFAAPTLAARRPWNVVVIALDTVRADQTSILGDRPRGRDTTPHLRELAERGINYRHAITQAPWTIPAFASVLTGRYPHEHGALELSARLPQREVTLAEILREAGYDTGGVVSHMFLQRFRGFAQGYDAYDESATRVADIHDVITSIAVTESAIEFLDRERDGPFFLFAHYFDPHYEYRDHARFDLADGYDGWFRDQLDFENLQENARLLHDEDVDWLVDLYHEELLYTDHHVGRLLRHIGESGRMENTLVVVVADHGEEFREHGGFGHTTNLYQEVLHVPLVIAPPDLARGVVVEETVETRRVFGAVLELVGLAARESEPGSLTSLAEAGPGPGPQRAFSVVWLGRTNPMWGKRFDKAALVEGRDKVLFDLTRSRTELYDLAADPGERRRVADEARAKALRATLDEWVGRMQSTAAQTEKAELDVKTLEEMRKLGYAGAEEEEEESQP